MEIGTKIDYSLKTRTHIFVNYYGNA